MNSTTNRVPGVRAECLKCGQGLELEARLLVGEVLHCERCGAQLEVTELDPLVLAPRARVEDEEEAYGDLE